MHWKHLLKKMHNIGPLQREITSGYRRGGSSLAYAAVQHSCVRNGIWNAIFPRKTCFHIRLPREYFTLRRKLTIEIPAVKTGGRITIRKPREAAKAHPSRLPGLRNRQSAAHCTYEWRLIMEKHDKRERRADIESDKGKTTSHPWANPPRHVSYIYLGSAEYERIYWFLIDCSRKKSDYVVSYFWKTGKTVQ